MNFASLTFLCLFLPTTMAAYHLCARFVRGTAVRKVLLLAVNLVFYTWTAFEYLPFILALVLLNYLFALLVDRASGKTRTGLLALVVLVDAGLLVFYKFFGYISIALDKAFELSVSPFLQPLGLSFLAFSLISYVVDVYRGTLVADKNVLNVLVWATYFPKIVSGPIVRYEDMRAGLEGRPRIEVSDVSAGARRFVIGLAKKVMIATYFGDIADTIFVQQPYESSVGLAWLGLLAFTLQLFFDFAGYSDMALGLARMMGFRFKENFDYPYVSRSITEFWHRWHISLSTWFRDYLYFPLGGSRRGNVYGNLIVVFAVSGIWHGSGPTFLLWGLWHGIFIALEKWAVSHETQVRLPAAVSWAFTTLVVMVGWVFFRSSGLDQAFGYLGNLVGLGVTNEVGRQVGYYLTREFWLYLFVSLVLCTPVCKRMCERLEGNLAFEVARVVGVVALFALCLIFVVNSTFSPFLYEQF